MRKWNFVRNQVAVDIEIMARQLQEGTITTERAVADLVSFVEVLQNTRDEPLKNVFIGVSSPIRQLWLQDDQVTILVRALAVYRNVLNDRLKTKSTILHTARCSECRKGEWECAEMHELDVEEDYAKELQGEVEDLMRR